MEQKKKFAVILSGCGVYDGAEIHEATLSLLAIDKAGALYQCFAPDIQQHHVVNHLTGKEVKESRNVLVEAARIARGKIKPLTEFYTADFDYLLLPGGFGVAKNLCSLAFDGPDCQINREVELAIIHMHKAAKPIGALCIAPALLARVIEGATVTIGDDEGTTIAIEKMGGIHQEKGHGEITIDKKNRLVTTPCYMLNASISQVESGVNATIKALLSL